jgi:hypothetical protein
VTPQSYKLWGRRGQPSYVIHDSRCVKPWCLYYYSAVNAWWGGLKLKLVTGTEGTGYIHPKNYKVGGGSGSGV